MNERGRYGFVIKFVLLFRMFVWNEMEWPFCGNISKKSAVNQIKICPDWLCMKHFNLECEW